MARAWTSPDVAILVHATPGTHPDHLAFEVPAADVVLVGDLEGPAADAGRSRSRWTTCAWRDPCERYRGLHRAIHLAAHD